MRDPLMEEYKEWLEQAKKFEELDLIPGQNRLSDDITINIDKVPALESKIETLTKRNIELEVEVKVLSRLVDKLTSRNSYD